MSKLVPVGKSSTGMDENIAGLLSVVLGWVSGLIFYLIEKDSTYVKFYALQSLIFFGGSTVLISVLGKLGLFGGIASSLIGLVSFAVWILLMIKAYQGEWFELPYVGEFAKNNSAAK